MMIYALFGLGWGLFFLGLYPLSLAVWGLAFLVAFEEDSDDV